MKGFFGKGGIAGSGNTVIHQKAFGKIFTAFELCTMPGRAYDGYIFELIILQKKVGNAVNERVFGAGNDEVNFIIKNKLTDSIKIGWLYIDVGAAKQGAGIARSDEKIFTKRALSEFEGKGMLAATGTEKKDVHCGNFGKEKEMGRDAKDASQPYTLPRRPMQKCRKQKR